MNIAQIILALEQLIAAGIPFVPMVQGWITDRDYLKTLQDQHGADYVPVAADFAAYDARSAAAEAQIDADAAAAGG